jgi:cell division protein FtsQ
VIKQSGDTNRPPIWEDEAPAETRYRRVQQGVPPLGRTLPGMPLEMTDPEGDETSRLGGGRFGDQRRPWWRPSSTWGRAFLGLGTLIALSGLVIAVFLLKTYLERDARFRIAGAENIEATGLTEVSRGEMLPVFGEDIGRNIFFVPLAERRRQLEQIPWVERATVMRLLPDQIRVSVVERQPVAFVRQGQQVGLVDSNGVLLSMPAAMMAQHHYSFPVVTGIDPHDPPAGRKGRMALYGRLLAELDANNQHLSEQISEIDLTDPEDARILMPEQGTDILAHFGEDQFLERYQRYIAHIAEWRQQYPKLAEVDLRYEQQVVLEMASGTGTAQAAAEPSSNPVADEPPAVEPAKKAPAKPAAKVKPLKAANKPGAKGTANAKKTTSKERKKRAEAKRAALNLSRQKSSQQTRPAVVVSEGQ